MINFFAITLIVYFFQKIIQLFAKYRTTLVAMTQLFFSESLTGKTWDKLAI